MTAAYKQGIVQTFCIPISGSEDADAVSHSLRHNDHVPQPVQGWQQWTLDILVMVRICETGEAIDQVQSSNRLLLKAISRERPDLYRELGQTIGERRSTLSVVGAGAAAKIAAKSRKTVKSNGAGFPKRSRRKKAEVSAHASA